MPFGAGGIQGEFRKVISSEKRITGKDVRGLGMICDEESKRISHILGHL